ncbi:MAG: hypothetical protein NWF05_02395 [Candidatus Bathyarchaeota archaeon]|nr:hypothetical protein [Candidatus Bathyarchaeota archaeon]
MQKKGVDKNGEAFSLRIKIGEYEVELSGAHTEVMATAESLPDLIANVNRAFESAKPKTVATITVKTAEETKHEKTAETPAQNYPKIEATERADQAVLRLLESAWGKWRPRTVEELKEALTESDLKFSERAFVSALDKLVKKGQVRRWNTNTGFVYILAEQKMKFKGE